MSDFFETKKDKGLENALEALLFVSPVPISIIQLADILDEKPKKIEDALENLSNMFINSRGLRLQKHNGRYQITSAPEFTRIIETLLGSEENTRLTLAACEALAIVSYKQPITRPEIEDIRGVNSDGVVRNLLNKGLIQEVGRGEGAGRPILYGTTPDFLQHFGLSSIEELPKFDLLPESKNGGNKILKD